MFAPQNLESDQTQILEDLWLGYLSRHPTKPNFFYINGNFTIYSKQLIQKSCSKFQFLIFVLILIGTNAIVWTKIKFFIYTKAIDAGFSRLTRRICYQPLHRPLSHAPAYRGIQIRITSSTYAWKSIRTTKNMVAQVYILLYWCFDVIITFSL